MAELPKTSMLSSLLAHISSAAGRCGSNAEPPLSVQLSAASTSQGTQEEQVEVRSRPGQDDSADACAEFFLANGYLLGVLPPTQLPSCCIRPLAEQ